MNLNGIVKAILGTNSAIVTAVAGRVYPSVIPQKMTFPAIVTTVISGRGNGTKDTTSDANISRVQIDVYALTTEQADTIAEAVRDTLELFSGSVTVGQKIYTVQASIFENEAQLYENDKELSRISHDYTLYVPRATVTASVGVAVVNSLGERVVNSLGEAVIE